MAFDKKEIKQLKGLFGEQKTEILEAVDKKLGSMESRMNKNVDQKLDGLGLRFDRKLDNLESRIYKNVDQKLGSMESRMNKSVDSKIDSKIDNLAVMIKKGFDGCASKQDLNEVKDEVRVLGGRFDRVELRQDQAVYRFELHALEKRVNVLETHAGVNR